MKERESPEGGDQKIENVDEDGVARVFDGIRKACQHATLIESFVRYHDIKQACCRDCGVFVSGVRIYHHSFFVGNWHRRHQGSF